MLRRLVTVLVPAAVLAVGTAAAPAVADDGIWCVKVQESIGEITGPFVIQGPVPLPPYPNRVCVPVPIDPPVELPPIGG
jgi:hypothetical protein